MTCELCGAQSRDVRVGLASWRDPIDKRAYDHIARCTDRQACRDRVEAKGEEWPLTDLTVSRVAR